MRALLVEAGYFISETFGRLTINDAFDVLICAFIIYQLVQLTRKTRSSQVVKGLAIILVGAWLANAFHFQLLQWILDYVVKSGAVAIVVLFQPELRTALERLGRRTVIERVAPDQKATKQAAIENIVDALLTLSRRKVGALIVIEQQTGLNDVMQSGTLIDSLISSALIENIFEPNTPLHDGAMILHGTRIICAGCVLPLTDNNRLSKELGTRHRAGLGMTEVSDAISLIVSEETGTISMAKAGRLTRHLDADSLRVILGDIYEPNKEGGFTIPFLKRRNGS